MFKKWKLTGYDKPVGSIPVCTGPPAITNALNTHYRVYPRVYGATPGLILLTKLNEVNLNVYWDKSE